VNLVLTTGSAVLVCISAAAIALGRETRWSIIAWWINGMASSSLLLCFGAELFAVVMAMSVTLCSLACFLHADTFGALSAQDRLRVPRIHVKMLFPLLVSAGLGVTVIALLKAAISGAVRTFGTPGRGTSFFAEESFIAFQLVALFGMAAVLGAGVIARPARESTRRSGDRSLHG
jgi:hypothetical protein